MKEQTAVRSWEPPLPQFEQPDGRLLSPTVDLNLIQQTVIRWNSDGTLDPTFRPEIMGFDSCHLRMAEIASVKAGQILLWGPLVTVDGFPRRGLARLLANPPERDFRVLTPAEFSRSSSVARVHVLRTGPTTNAASVSFTTSDHTAKAGEDYVPQSGTLNFAPLEVSREVAVPLFAKTPIEGRRTFNLELSNPSAGYAIIASTPIIILPDLRIATQSLRPRGDGSVVITLQGTLPGITYGLDVSTDLKNWYGAPTAPQAAAGPKLVFDPVPIAFSRLKVDQRGVVRSSVRLLASLFKEA